jgi:hypothetical protein
MDPVCAKCQAQYLPNKNGVYVVETAGNPPLPYRIWRADLLACPICRGELTAHFSHEPLSERHEDGFDAFLSKVQKGPRYILHNPEYLVQRVGFETRYVRSYARN